MTSLRSKDFCSSSPHATRRFELPTLSHAKSPPKGELLAWLGIRDDYRTLIGLDNLGIVEIEDGDEDVENSDV